METLPHPAPSWYLIQTKPRQEDIARLVLEREGYSVYLPNFCTRKLRDNGTDYLAMEPLFPNHLFVQLGEEEACRNQGAIEACRGVATMVLYGGKPARVDEGLIRAMKNKELTSTGSLPVRPSTAGPDQHGDPRIETLYRNTDGARRCRILDNLLNGPVIVNLDDFRKRRLKQVS